ncbi:hypothetical protein [Streptomyces sp. TR06-5]|uniref:hypothetical protein n=1 Tax=unclassified Streptomyces TaxID=2593676 RepID=UPI00399F2333
MPLRFPQAPATARQSVLAALEAGSGSSTPRLHPVTALPVHEVTGVSRQGPTRTGLTGWRFLLAPPSTGAEGPGAETAPPAVSAAEVVPAPGGWAFAHFRGGPYVTSTLRALGQAEALPGTYQPRLLSVPELYMVTLWLHGVPDANPHTGVPDPADLLVPLAPAPPGIAPHRPGRADALLPLLTRRLTSTPLLHTTP